MKKNVKSLLYGYHKKIRWHDECFKEYDQESVLALWPDMKSCIQQYSKLYPILAQHHMPAKPVDNVIYTTQFWRSVNKHCATKELRIKLIDALAKLIYKIPSSGLDDTPIKEKTDLRHIKVSHFWRLFYRKANNTMILLEFCPHKKLAHSRRF